MVQGEVIELLKQYCLLLNLSGIKVDKAFLYGSYAREEATKDSDIDIMLVSQMFDANEADANIKALSFTRKADSRIEPYTVGLKQFLTDDISPLLQIRY